MADNFTVTGTDGSNDGITPSLRGAISGGSTGLHRSALSHIASLGPRQIPSPLRSVDGQDKDQAAAAEYFVPDGACVQLNISHVRQVHEVDLAKDPLMGLSQPSVTDVSGESCAQRAGPRRMIYFDPASTRAGIVSCGGLCPGTNDVIRALVMALWYRYGVREIEGFQYGFEGLNPETSTAIKLTPSVVKDIPRFGGTMLGSSRGPQDVGVMVDFLKSHNIDILFCIGGDGTLRGMYELSNEIARRNLQISVIGVPKTIDNDISFTQRTFGFETAVDRALIAVTSAHAEARSQRNCVGLVKVMGRESGFVALYAALASPDVNLLLIPEVPFTLEKVMKYVTKRLETRGHCLVVVAEGAGQDLMREAAAFDKSGNIKLGDIGTYLRDEFSAYFKRVGMDAQVKYIDPSYMIRSAPASAGDSIFCQNLAHMAVHAGMAGFTSMVVGLMNGQFVHLPVDRVVEVNKRVDPSELMYQLVLDSTGTPRVLH